MRNEDTYANDVKGYGTTYPCGWMGIKKPSGFPQAIQTPNEKR